MTGLSLTIECQCMVNPLAKKVDAHKKGLEEAVLCHLLACVSPGVADLPGAQTPQIGLLSWHAHIAQKRLDHEISRREERVAGH